MFGSFFFFKQKTAYEMRISDWSSDVCSSDLDHFLTTRKIDMTINKALLALAMGFALAACSNQQQADDSAADAADAAAAAQTAADEAAAAGSMTADVAQDAADTAADAEIGRAHV